MEVKQFETSLSGFVCALSGFVCADVTTDFKFSSRCFLFQNLQHTLKHDTITIFALCTLSHSHSFIHTHAHPLTHAHNFHSHSPRLKVKLQNVITADMQKNLFSGDRDCFVRGRTL